jgi:hypothetical protein
MWFLVEGKDAGGSWWRQAETADGSWPRGAARCDARRLQANTRVAVL